ncbi:hypothetical protein COY27_05815 [Candidatus Woesearchaeota archaeon CG_4_10_14_0_2_um_filter_33_13]|nr:MAG: hypothetical protein COY27_05815 [Candidatus Woesearchaeota archaeon CG_4_10_14_0_2_um_filter_33_13]
MIKAVRSIEIAVKPVTIPVITPVIPISTKIDTKKGELLAKKARNSIGQFCHDECGAYCCRKGYLVLSQKELDLLLNSQEALADELKLIKQQNNGNFSLFIGNSQFPCPRLDNMQCSIHKNKSRPQCCKDFPLFLKDDKFFLSPRCPAVKYGKFYKYETQFKKLGYTQVEPASFSEIEFQNVN